MRKVLKNGFLTICFLALCETCIWAYTPDDDIQSIVDDRQIDKVSSNDSLQQNDNSKNMKLKITIGDKSVMATMYDNATAKDFISMLPLTLNLDDYAGTEKISYLSRKLTTQGATSGCDPDVGDITYYAPWGNLAIFYKDYGYASGLIKLGKIEGDISLLNTAQNPTASFEMVKQPNE